MLSALALRKKLKKKAGQDFKEANLLGYLESNAGEVGQSSCGF